MRRASAVFLTVVVVLAGLAPVAAAAPGDAAVDPAPVEATTVQTADNESTPADPESDRLGWENGYWHNESIDVDQSDGLTEAELNATVSRAMARVEVIRGLEFDMEPPVEIISREEFASSGNRSYSEAFRTFDDTKFEALFMIGESEDSIEVQDENRGATVGGYYSPSADSIVLVADNASELQVDELTLGHELVHAIQDQEFDLTSYTSETRDGANANSGLIEGDANYVQYRYEQRCGEGGSWNGTCLSPESGDGGGGAGPANWGVYFVNYQPYSDGPTFIASQYREGGWEAVNDLYDAPPESAEQVIHPDRYGEDAPTEVNLTDQHGDGWERVRPESRLDYAEVGQAGVASMFIYPWYAGEGISSNYGETVLERNGWLNLTSSGEVSTFDPLNYGFEAAAGWDGDRMHFYRNADGETGYVWRLVWDSPADATLTPRRRPDPLVSPLRRRTQVVHRPVVALLREERPNQRHVVVRDTRTGRLDRRFVRRLFPATAPVVVRSWVVAHVAHSATHRDTERALCTRLARHSVVGSAPWSPPPGVRRDDTRYPVAVC